jgi:hypothetical protein
MAITQEYMAELKRRSDEQTEALVGSAGHNPILDSYRSGVIAAYKDAVDFHFEEDSA